MRFTMSWRAAAAFAAALVPCITTAAQSARPSNAEILFRLANPCPVTGLAQGACNGYVVDRVIPVFCGGAEDPSNMQWQTLAQAKEKDRWEKIGCRKGRRLVLPTESKSITEAFATGELPGGVQAQSLPVGGTAPAPDATQRSAAPEVETAETEPPEQPEPETAPP